MIGLVHSCYLHTRDQRLAFDAGSVAPSVGSTVTGSTSHATGLVKSVAVSTGSWGSGNAAGYLVLSGVSGTFINNEPLVGAPAGAATADGANSDYVDDYGRKSTTVSSTATRCRFINLRAPSGGDFGWSGRLPAIWLSPGTSLFSGQRLTTAEAGFSGIYEIQWPPVYYPNASGGVHHITCAIVQVSE
jgi:hypothetical protein